jgi:type IV pilus assembly protein PilB
MRISDSLAETLLKQSGAFSKERLAELHAHSLKTHQPLQDLIIENDLLSEEELTSLYAQELGLPFIEVPAGHINHRILTRLPEHAAIRYNAVAFDVDDAEDRILVAIEDPVDAQTLSFLQKRLGENLKLHITTTSLLKSALDQYRNNRSSALSKVMAHQDVSDEPHTVNPALVADGSAAAESVSHIIEQAVHSGASDIHIEPRVDHVVIRYRIDGLLREAHKLPLSSLALLVGSIKTASQLKLSEHHAPQYGQWNVALGDQHYGIRVTVMPTVDGEKVVLHIVQAFLQAPSLRDLGLWGTGLRNLQKSLTESRGTLFVSGPIGSGKAMTLFSLLSTLSSPNVNIATIEDALEYRIAGANQVQVNPASGVTFISGLQAILNQDPNIIMVSELRDQELSHMVIQAATAGHLVLSALHNDSAAAGVRRLLDMHIEPFLITSTLQAMLGQRLVRKLCPNCREATKPDLATLKQIEKLLRREDTGLKRLHELEITALAEGVGVVEHEGKTFPKAHDPSSTARSITRVWNVHEGGCDRCYYTGYRGRVGIFEVLTASEAVQKAIMSSGSTKVINKAAHESGMLSMQLDGLIKALRGQTTVSEVLRVSA